MTSPFQVVKDFERALAEYTGAPYVVTTTSCTMALLLATAWHLHCVQFWKGDRLVRYGDDVQIPRRTYVGVPYAIREAGGRPTFRDEAWRGTYQLKPLPVWDSARWLTSGMYHPRGLHGSHGTPGVMLCVSFHWSKHLGIQQGGAILHDNPEADGWFRRARFDGRTEGMPPSMDTFPLERAWHAYMSPETAAAGLVRLAHLPRHNEPLPNDDYPDLSQFETFQIDIFR